MGRALADDQVTELLNAWVMSRREPPTELFALIYKELHEIARGYMRKERADHTLQTTALVHEAYLRIAQGEPFQWDNRKHFFCAMAQTMRRILVDHARRHQAHKRGGEHQKSPLENVVTVLENRTSEVLAVHEALERFAALNPRQGQVVEMRFFVGLTAEETAAMLDISPETVKLDWRFAKAWLRNQMKAVNRCGEHDDA